FIHRELQEFDAVQNRRCRQRRMPGSLGFVQDQRAKPVERHKARGGGAKVVVEYLKRQRALVAAAKDSAGESGYVEIALPGKIAEMPAPAQDVHGQLRR